MSSSARTHAWLRNSTDSGTSIPKVAPLAEEAEPGPVKTVYLTRLRALVSSLYYTPGAGADSERVGARQALQGTPQRRTQSARLIARSPAHPPRRGPLQDAHNLLRPAVSKQLWRFRSPRATSGAFGEGQVAQAGDFANSACDAQAPRFSLASAACFPIHSRLPCKARCLCD